MYSKWQSRLRFRKNLRRTFIALLKRWKILFTKRKKQSVHHAFATKLSLGWFFGRRLFIRSKSSLSANKEKNFCLITINVHIQSKSYRLGLSFVVKNCIFPRNIDAQNNWARIYIPENGEINLRPSRQYTYCIQPTTTSSQNYINYITYCTIIGSVTSLWALLSFGRLIALSVAIHLRIPFGRWRWGRSGQLVPWCSWSAGYRSTPTCLPSPSPSSSLAE